MRTGRQQTTWRSVAERVLDIRPQRDILPDGAKVAPHWRRQPMREALGRLIDDGYRHEDLAWWSSLTERTIYKVLRGQRTTVATEHRLRRMLDRLESGELKRDL